MEQLQIKRTIMERHEKLNENNLLKEKDKLTFLSKDKENNFESNFETNTIEHKTFLNLFLLFLFSAFNNDLI